ncbi:HAD-like protein [Periconia macrospinosa]|uniref:Mitochondrial import inner membrane translocase subunit TIM50 n=1 Tax=Periconia macrospinosa TaxID=97972 RepID=A0A2V1DKU3_9PLEO|nr:HAD-like protein [Periconia macrospinosa]
MGPSPGPINPIPSTSRTSIAACNPHRTKPQDMLIILDLNGTLIYREESFRPRNPKFITRPYLPEFLEYLFGNFQVMVWSSASRNTINEIVRTWPFDDHRSALVAKWNRHHTGIAAADYHARVHTYKNLENVWASDEIQKHHPEYSAGKRYNQDNTILLDDSWPKASAQPFNVIKVPTYQGNSGDNEDIFGEVWTYLELLRRQPDVSNYMHKRPFRNSGFA